MNKRSAGGCGCVRSDQCRGASEVHVHLPGSSTFVAQLKRSEQILFFMFTGSALSLCLRRHHNYGHKKKLYRIKSVGNIYRDTLEQKNKIKWRYRVVSFRAHETLILALF